MRQPFHTGSSDSSPDTHSPVFAEAEARTRGGPVRTRIPGTTRARTHAIPDVYIAMGQTAENVAQLRGISRQAQDEFGVRSQNLAEKALADGFWGLDITPATLPDGTVVAADDGPRPGTTLEKVATLKPVFRPDGTVTAGNCCPLNDGAAALVIMSDRKAADLGITPLARIVSTGLSALSPEIMGLGPVAGVTAGPQPRRDDDRRHRSGRDQRGLRRPGHPVLQRSGDRRRTS